MSPEPPSAVASLTMSRPTGRPIAAGLAWTAVCGASSSIVAVLALALVSPARGAGTQTAATATLSNVWWCAFAVFVPVLLAARRSLLMALPAVVVAAAPQFLAATVGLSRIRADDGLEALIYLVPACMTALFLLGALVGGILRVVDLRSSS
jgi:hypothetical protein